MVQGEFVLIDHNDYAVTLSYKQLIIWGVTAVLLAAFWYLVAKTRSAARSAPASRTRRWRRWSASTSTAPSR